MRKPSWDDAPEQSFWLAQDDSGDWWWYVDKPELGEKSWWDEVRCDCDECPSDYYQVYAGNSPVLANWKETLEHRP